MGIVTKIVSYAGEPRHVVGNWRNWVKAVDYDPHKTSIENHKAAMRALCKLLSLTEYKDYWHETSIEECTFYSAFE